MEKLWTTAEVARFLQIPESDVDELVRAGRLTGYRLGGRFLRFRPEQVKLLKPQIQPRRPDAMAARPSGESWSERLRDTLYFYDFYLLSGILLVALIIYVLWPSG